MDEKVTSLHESEEREVNELLAFFAQEGWQLTAAELKLVQLACRFGFSAGVRCVFDDFDKVLGTNTATARKPDITPRTPPGLAGPG